MTLEERLAAIEARQREYGMHDPGCKARAVERSNAHGLSYYNPEPCNCWLSRPGGADE
jgi:hypothetical protein